MNFIDWLPVTARNRVALGLAGLALVVFVTWNLLPMYERADEPPVGMIMETVWPSVISPANYLDVLKSPDIDGFINISASVALLQSGLVTLLAIPCWKLLHGSAYVRLPLAIANLLGGSVVVWGVIESEWDDAPPFVLLALGLIALGMFTISAALFTFKNELALREARSHGMRCGAE